VRRSDLDDLPRDWCHLELREVLGQGAYGTVYRALDRKLDREVALKLTHQAELGAAGGGGGASSGAGVVAGGVVKEAHLMSRVRHRNIVTVYGADESDRQVGIWMELVRGRTLADLVYNHGPLSAQEAAIIGVDLCRALTALHLKDIVHCDVKAQNVMREAGGRIVLMDLGVGRQQTVGEEETQAVAGTPLYMAPEVLSGAGEASARSDLYSLGVLLFFLVSGEYPFEATTLAELREKLELGDRRLLQDLCPGIPEGFCSAVDRALVGDPEARYPSAGQFERDLSAAVVSERPAEVASRAPLVRGLTGLLLLVTALLVSTSVIMVRKRYPEAKARLERAKSIADQGDYGAALDVLQTSFDIFPPFALGYDQKARWLDTVGQYVEATTASEKARRYAAWIPFRWLLGEQDRRRITASYYLYRLQYEKARRWLVQAALLDEAEPDLEAWRQLAMLWGNLNEPGEAVTDARDAHAAASGDGASTALLAMLLVENNEPEAALDLLRSMFDPSLGSDVVLTAEVFVDEGAEKNLAWSAGMAYLASHHFGSAREAFRSMQGDKDIFKSVAYRFLAQTVIYEALLEGPVRPDDPRLLDAVELVRQGIGLDNNKMRSVAPSADGVHSSAERGRKYLFLARIQLLQGDRLAALKSLGQIESLPNAPILLKHFREAAALYAELEVDADFAAIKIRIESICEAAPSELCRGTIPLLEGYEAVLFGDLDGARRAFDDAVENWPDPLARSSRAAFLTSIGDLGGEAASLDSIRGRTLSCCFSGLLFPWEDSIDGLAR